MKKIMTIALGVLFSTGVFAGGTDEYPSSNSGIAVMKQGAATFNLIYKGTGASNVKVVIYDAKNKMVFSERVRSSEGFMRPYNFNGLPEGEYSISVTDQSGERTEKIAYRFGSISKLVNVKKLGGESKFLMTAAGQGTERIRLNIFDESDKLIHSESNSISADFARIYNLSKFDGHLTFEIIHENGESKRIDY